MRNPTTPKETHVRLQVVELLDLIPPTIFTHAKAHALMVILEQDEEDNWGYVARKHPSGSDAFVIDVMDSEGHMVGSL